MSNTAQPTITVQDGVAYLTFPTDDYTLSFAELSRTKYGSLYSEVTARHRDQVLHVARFDLLNQREQEHFHQRCLSVNGTCADWQSRLQSAIPGLKTLVITDQAPTTITCWEQAVTAADFLLQEETEVQADVKDLVIPGCITLLAAPRASGKTLVAMFLGVGLATGGIFRGERLPQRRVVYVDRDNPPALIRKRLRWLGGHKVTGLKLLTRDQAPPLTDAAAWAAFPADHYDVVIVDSIGAATEGVSEKEGKQTQQYLATLKDLARRGPAILALDNTNKAAANYRGRGEKADAVDILYEARNITGWTPSQAGDWWEDLPDFGEHTWQQRASRRKGQAVMHIAFIPSKFRLGAEPEPFALEIDTRQEPWTLADMTNTIATAGDRAAQEAHQQERAKLEQASRALVNALRGRSAMAPLLKREAETLLRGQGLSSRAARTLLEQGGNRDVYPDGLWVLRPIPDERGNPVGVYCVGEEDGVPNNNVPNPPRENGTPDLAISDTRSTPSGQKTPSSIARKYTCETGPLFGTPHGCEVYQIATQDTQEICGSQKVGIISHTSTHTNAALPITPPCALCGGCNRWQDHGVQRCVACYPPLAQQGA
jgi:hypothetical protein